MHYSFMICGCMECRRVFGYTRSPDFLQMYYMGGEL